MDVNKAYLTVVGQALSDLKADPSLTLHMAINNSIDEIEGLSELDAEEVFYFAKEEIQRQTQYLDQYERSEV